jgi:hypothetical protein
MSTSTTGPIARSVNFSYDIEGTPDSRPGTWGATGVQTIPDLFHPPSGHQTRILRLYGDFIAWPHGSPSAGKFAGVLWGLTNSSPQGSPQEDLAAEGCFLYLQQGVGASEPVRAAFDLDVSVDGLLNADNQMLSKVAVFLNELQCSIHIEVTFICEFQFEPIQAT